MALMKGTNMSYTLEVSVGSNAAFSAPPRNKLKQSQNQNNDVLELTPIQQRKKDALDMAELVYKIYNDSCPALSKGSVTKENENV